MDYVERNGLLSPQLEGFRRGHSCQRAVAALQMTLEDAIASKRNVFLAYIDFKGAYPSVDHGQLSRTLRALGMPMDFVHMVTDLYKGATTTVLTPYGSTGEIPVERGTLQGDPLSPLLFDLMLEPFTQWLSRGDNGYVTKATNMAVTNVDFADDLTLVADSLDKLQRHLHKLEMFSRWAHIFPYVPKGAVTAYVQNFQRLAAKPRAEALKALLGQRRVQGPRGCGP
jgi:hypothetical protein